VDTSKLSVGDQIAAVSGIVLLIALFLPWYGVDVSVGGFSASESANAWEALDFVDILLFLIALVAIGVPVAKATGNMPDDVPGPMVVLAAGGLAVLLVVFRLIDLPTPDVEASGIDFSRKFGIFLGLIAAAGVTYGGWRANEEAPVAAAPAAPPPPPAPTDTPA
jgi:hypothetical protein